mgnify:CR=1 FL=1
MCFFFQAEDGIRDSPVTGVQTCSSDLTAWQETQAAITSVNQNGMIFMGRLQKSHNPYGLIASRRSCNRYCDLNIAIVGVIRQALVRSISGVEERLVFKIGLVCSGG